MSDLRVYRVDGMSFDGCIRAITDAIRKFDPAAFVQVDLWGGTVSVAGAGQFLRRDHMAKCRLRIHPGGSLRTLQRNRSRRRSALRLVRSNAPRPARLIAAAQAPRGSGGRCRPRTCSRRSARGVWQPGKSGTPAPPSPCYTASSEGSGSARVLPGSSPITNPRRRRKHARSQGPSLRRRYPASAVP